MPNPIAVPGTNVPSGAAVSPGGAQGVAGTPAWTTCTSSFTIPAVGSTVSVPVVDTSWITTGEMIYVDQAGGTGQSGVLQVTGKAGNTLTLLNPTPAPAIPPADVTQAGLLKQISGNTTDFVDGTNACQNLVAAIQPTIWSARLRNYNAVGNPTFEVDQRNVGSGVANIPSNTFLLDRWSNLNTAATLRYNAGQATGGIAIPGTNFRITNNNAYATLGTQQASLAAGEVALFVQNIEGPRLRELIGDVHSLSLLLLSTVVGGQKVAVSIRDPGATRSLVKLVTIPYNVWTLVQLPNLPLFPGAGNFSLNPGAVGYMLGICFACGSTFMAPAADTWQNGNFVGAPGMDNFGSKAVNSSLAIGFVQHEPGALCTTLIDCPFGQNYDDCMRYFFKTYDYAAALGAVTGYGRVGGLSSAALPGYILGYFPYGKALAKLPTFATWSDVTGAFNNVRNQGTAADVAASGFTGNQKAFHQLALGGSPAAASLFTFHFIADTGW